MNRTLQLTVTTPAIVLVKSDDVVAVRAEDESGCFGILPGHADLLTMLTPSVVRWQTAAGAPRFCAVRGGVLTVAHDGVTVATPEAVVGEDLQRLEANVACQFRRQLEDERTARSDAQRLQFAAIRRIVQLLRPEPKWPAPGGPDLRPDVGLES